MRLLLAANNQATRQKRNSKSYLQLGSSSNRYASRLPQQETSFFPSNAFMASARSSNSKVKHRPGPETTHKHTHRHTGKEEENSCSVQERNWDAQREKAYVDAHAHASAPQICLQNMCGQQQNFQWLAPLWVQIWTPKPAQERP